MIVRADEMAKSLKAFGRLAKPLVVKACDESFDGKKLRTVKHSLITFRDEAQAATIPHDVLRKYMDSLLTQSVNVAVNEDGMRIQYERGELFLRHQPGERTDAVEMSIS